MPEYKDDLLLSIKELQVFYGGIQALHGISLDIRKGEIVSIIGANGAGKSTLLKAIAGDKEIGNGTIEFEKNCPLKSTSSHKTVFVWYRRVGKYLSILPYWII